MISDAALDAYYADIYKRTYGYDPLDPDDTYEENDYDPDWEEWVKPSERE